MRIADPNGLAHEDYNDFKKRVDAALIQQPEAQPAPSTPAAKTEEPAK